MMMARVGRPAQINPPDGSYDHQSVGAGPYPASLPLGNDINKGSAVYYCSQVGVNGLCSRSDTGGLTFNRSVPIFGLTDGCGGIHGHPKVAPDGTVYVPVRGCNNVQAVTVSEDARHYVESSSRFRATDSRRRLRREFSIRLWASPATARCISLTSAARPAADARAWQSAETKA